MIAPAWRDANLRDGVALEQFTCTVDRVPERRPDGTVRKRHPAEWERSTQAIIRHQLTPRCTPTSMVRILEDEHGIIAIVSAQHDPGPNEVHLGVVACALRVRRAGMRLGDTALREGMRWAIASARDAGERELAVTAKVDPLNVNSRALLDRAGFALIDEQNDPPYDLWEIRVRVEPARTESLFG